MTSTKPFRFWASNVHVRRLAMPFVLVALLPIAIILGTMKEFIDAWPEICSAWSDNSENNVHN